MPVTRRELLVAVAGLAAAGCTGHRPVTRRPDPDAAARGEAVATERALVAGYDALLAMLPAAAGLPAFTAARAVHVEHLRALGVDATSASPTASAPASPASPSRTPATAERASVAPLQRLARAAVDGDTAALLASIAASHTALAATVPSVRVAG